MKLRLELLLAPFALAAVWLALDVRAPRQASDRASLPGEEPSAPQVGVELAEPAAPEIHGGAGPQVEQPRATVVRDTVPLAPRSIHGTSRGRLVDAATLEPIPEALVATSVRNDWTDAAGWFDTGDVLDGLEELMVVNIGIDTNIHEAPRERWTPLANGWQVPLEIGPTFRLRFTGIDDPSAVSWEGRLRRDRGREERWHPVRKGPLPYLRYGHPFLETVPATSAWLELRSTDGLHEGLVDAVSLVGVQEVEAACRARPVLRGRVVDERGAPIGDVPIDAIQLSDGATEALHTSTGEDGSYQLAAHEPGRMQLAILPPASTTTRKLELDVPRGITRAQDVVLERRAPAGDISGQLWVQSKELEIVGSLRLRALDGSGYEEVQGFRVGGRRAIASTQVGGGVVETSYEEPRHTEEFRFEHVPAGRFELTASDSLGFACLPGSLEVSPPAGDLVFRFDNTVGVRSYFLELTDAESGAAVSGVFAQVQLHGKPPRRVIALKEGDALIELAEGVDFEWTVGSPAYRLVRGSMRDFVVRDDRLVATRKLRRGFGIRLEVRERREGADHYNDVQASVAGQRAIRSRVLDGKTWRWNGSPLSGAELLADGEPVATSDEHGIVELDLPSAPGRIEVRLPGWRVLDSWWEFRDGKVQSFPVAKVWMVRE